MASSKKKATAKTGLKFKDIKSKSNPKGGSLLGGLGQTNSGASSSGGGGGAGKLGKAEWLKI
jgi:hypothetical protein